MIDKVLDFIITQLDGYLRQKSDPSVSDPFIQLANVAWMDSETTTATSANSANAFISLVNIEEDRISKSSENFQRNPNGAIVYKSPKIFLNLYLLFSVNLSVYEESLKRLSFIIQFFQYQNVFTPLSNPGDAQHPFPDSIDELIFDLYTLSFQDLNNLWGIMGSKYLPSVMYKMRLIIIDENSISAEGSFIKSITVNSHQ